MIGTWPKPFEFERAEHLQTNDLYIHYYWSIEYGEYLCYYQLAMWNLLPKHKHAATQLLTNIVV